MSARRAMPEPMGVGSVVTGGCARRAAAAMPEVFEDTLTNVPSGRGRRAIAAPISFDPEEALLAGRPLGRLAQPRVRRSANLLQRGLLTVAAAATAGAALVVPNLSSQVTASEAVVSRAPAPVTTPISRHAERPDLVAPVTEREALEAERARIAEEQRVAEEARLAEEARAAEEARIAEEQRVAEEARLAEEARVAEEARLAEEARVAEQARLAQQSASQAPSLVAAPTATAAAPVVSGYASGTAQGAVSFALSQVGKAYAWGATGPDAYDCSGLMVAAYQSMGVSLPRTSGAMMSAGYAVSQGELQPGDLIISYGGGHVGMYIGNGQMVHSATYGVGVTVSSLSGYSIDAMRRVA